MTKEKLLNKKREELFRSLAVIHVTAKIQDIAYVHAIQGSNFRNPKIKAKADQLRKHSEDIIKSLGDAVRLKEEHADYMEYDHFTEVYQLLTKLLFIDTQSIRKLTKVLNGEITEASEEESLEIMNK